MQLGLCTSIENAAAAKAAGWEYVEVGAQSLLKGLEPDDAWTGQAQASASSLPIVACNVLVPGSLRITGDAVDAGILKAYMASVCRRAGVLGIRTLVFGSGGARNVPDAFDRSVAKAQIIDFLNLAAPEAQKSGVTLVIEPLNRKECNIINSIDEAMELVKAVGHPSIQCLLDTYHFWLEDEPLANLEAAVGHIRHVHVADKIGRVAPGLSGQADYRPVFRVLKQGGYDGPISFEGQTIPDFAQTSPTVIDFVRTQWQEA